MLHNTNTTRGLRQYRWAKHPTLSDLAAAGKAIKCG